LTRADVTLIQTQGDEMKTIKDITNSVGQPSAAPSHIDDPQAKKDLHHRNARPSARGSQGLCEWSDDDSKG
jgi:hypothetical protein